MAIAKKLYPSCKKAYPADQLLEEVKRHENNSNRH
nr:MAG TPA: hypothetical protein [Caudoviricetes sp.]